MGFRLVPKSVALNDLERRNSLYFAIALHVDYVKVVSFHFWPKLTHPAGRKFTTDITTRGIL